MARHHEIIDASTGETSFVPFSPEEEFAADAAERLLLVLGIGAERDRRIADTFTFGDVAYQLDDRSRANIAAMGADAGFAIAAGAQGGDLRWADPENDFGWIASDNSVTPMDAPTMFAFATAAKLHVARHTFAARALKDMDPPPADYADDAYWP